VAKGEPLVGTKPKDLAAAGVERVPRLTGVRDGLPLLEDGRVIDTANVIWATGFRPDYSWVDLPSVDGDVPAHDRGVVSEEPGLYLVGLKFLYALASSQVHGVGRDAARVAAAIANR
jgi:putative flavoprotein involved in K+ transport